MSVDLVRSRRSCTPVKPARRGRSLIWPQFKQRYTRQVALLRIFGIVYLKRGIFAFPSGLQLC